MVNKSKNQINFQFRWGDMSYIARLTGYTSVYVWLVVNGKRNNEEIMKVAEIVSKNNMALQKETDDRNN